MKNRKIIVIRLLITILIIISIISVVIVNNNKNSIVSSSSTTNQKEEQLFIAIQNKDTEQSKEIINSNINVNAKNKNGYSLLMQSIQYKNLEVEKLLIEKGANVNEKINGGDSILFMAVLMNDINCIKPLLEKKADVNYKPDKNSVSVLQRAILNKNLELVKLLVDYGANINSLDSYDYIVQKTPLPLANDLKLTDIASFLQSKGAKAEKNDIFAQSKEEDFNKAKELYQNGNYSSARDLFYQISNDKANKHYNEIKTMYIDNNYKLGNEYMAKKEYSLAETMFNEILSLYEDDKEVNSKFSKLESEAKENKENEIRISKDASRLNAPNPSIGMTAEEVKNSSWGSPTKINKTTTKYGTNEQWVYSLDRYIYLENGKVTAITE